MSEAPGVTPTPEPGEVARLVETLHREEFGRLVAVLTRSLTAPPRR